MLTHVYFHLLYVCTCVYISFTCFTMFLPVCVYYRVFFLPVDRWVKHTITIDPNMTLK